MMKWKTSVDESRSDMSVSEVEIAGSHSNKYVDAVQ
jgi:hypothetical protein